MQEKTKHTKRHIRLIKTNLLIGYFISAFFQIAHAQNAKEDIVKINKAFAETQTFSMQMTYNLYPNYSTNTVYSSEKGEMYKFGTNHYSKIATLETVVNDKYALVIDNNAQMIMVEPASVMAPKNVLPLNLDTLIKACKSIEYAKPSRKESEYILKMDFSAYQEVDIYFDPDTYVLTKLVLYSRSAQKLAEDDKKLRKEKPRLEIILSEMDLDPKLSPKTFSEKKYIGINGKTITGVGKYQTYKIVNGLQTL